MLDLKEGTVLELKKSHPCGSKNWILLKLGMECTIKCAGCGRVVMLSREDLEKRIKKQLA